MRALEEFWNEQTDPPNDAHADEVGALQDFVAETAALCSEGVLLKFKYLVRFCDLDIHSGVFVPTLISTITGLLSNPPG